MSEETRASDFSEPEEEEKKKQGWKTVLAIIIIIVAIFFGVILLTVAIAPELHSIGDLFEFIGKQL